VRGVLSSMFNVATRGSRKIGNLAGTTWVPPDTINPAAQVILPARQTASHNPTRAELAGLLQGVSDLGDVGEAIRLQAETCTRVTEVAALVWDELDLDEGVWLLPADRAKNGNAHKVMLSRQSIALLQRHKRNARTAFVFPGPVSGAHLTRNSVAKAIAANREAYGLAAGFKSHSLRHACLTWLAENGAGREIRDRISNHVENTSADSIYVAAERNGAARDWLQSWCNYLDSLTAPNVDQIA
jgi:integrase